MPLRLLNPLAVLLLSLGTLSACALRPTQGDGDKPEPPPAATPEEPVATQPSPTSPSPAPASATPPDASATEVEDAPVEERLFGTWIPDSGSIVWQETAEALPSTLQVTTSIGRDFIASTTRCTFEDGTVLDVRAAAPASFTAKTIKISKSKEAIDTDQSSETEAKHICTARVEAGTVRYALEGDYELELRFQDGAVASFVKQ